MQYALATSAIATSLLVISGAAMAADEPKHKLIMQDGNFELRQYPPMIIAQTTVTGNYNLASQKGFKTLANYIFGNNVASSSSNQQASSKIAMTAPVLMAAKNEKIAMTTPVRKAKASKNEWVVSFVMPAEYTIESIPKPNNPKVALVEVPATYYAIVKFSGLAGESTVSKKTRQLMSWVKKQQLNVTGIPEIARYNPPWTLPFMRRNEVMVQYEPVVPDAK